MEGIYPLLDEFKSNLEEIDPVLGNMDATMLQKMKEDKDRNDQKVQELEGSLVLMEDNLTKAKSDT